MIGRQDIFFWACIASFYTCASLTFFVCFFILFRSYYSHARAFGKTLVHELPISYSNTEWYLLFSDSATMYKCRMCLLSMRLSSHLPRLSLCLISFVLAVPMRDYLGKHSCMSFPFPIVMLNSTSFLLSSVQEKLNMPSGHYYKHCSWSDRSNHLIKKILNFRTL